jgi:transcriptional regulator with XRE-family HTH domain
VDPDHATDDASASVERFEDLFPPPDTVGRVVRALRAKIGWDQRELAQQAGVSPSTITNYERGTVKVPDVLVLRSISDALADQVGVDRDLIWDALLPMVVDAHDLQRRRRATEQRVAAQHAGDPPPRRPRKKRTPPKG